jgi:sigma-B regulation protein RsbU (phosphoserine phosphatase)
MPDDLHQPYALEVAISLKSVAHSFDDLRRNLILGVIVSIALLASLAIIGLRAPHYVRGKYLESELQLARRVQRDLQPKPQSVGRHVEFAASAVAADHVGGDFFDIFEAESGKIVIVLGDVAGKGVPAALLVSVLHGAIRSSTASYHELACARINRMLCERSACERFATLFWGVFDPAAGTLTYVNAGHAAPILLRNDGNRLQRLSEGGPVLGLFPGASYSAETVQIDPADTLILYSDGITEAMDPSEQEFGEERVEHIVSTSSALQPAVLCDRLIASVDAFAGADTPQDDRTLMIVRFQPSEHPAVVEEGAEYIAMAAAA